MTQGNERDHEKTLALRLGDDGPEAEVAPPIDGEPVYLEPHIQEQLGRVLRSFCDDLVQQPIPDKFVVLLAQLEAKQREKK